MSRSTQSSTSSYSESLSYTSEDPSLVSHTSMQKCNTSKPIVHGVSNPSHHLIKVKSKQSIITQEQEKILQPNKIYHDCNVHSSKCSTSSSKVQKSADSSFINNAHSKEFNKTNSAKKNFINYVGDNNKSLKKYPSNFLRSFSSVENEHNNKLGKINITLGKFIQHEESKDNNSFVSDRQVNNSFSASLPAISSPPHRAVYKRNSFNIPESDMSKFSINQCSKHENWEINNNNAHKSFTTSESFSIKSMEEHEHCHKVKQHGASSLMQRLTNTQCATHKVDDRTVNILVIGTPQSGKSSFINTYRECVAFHGRWPAAPVGACGGAGTLTIEPFPDNVIRPSWLCIDTPGTIFNIFDERKLEMLIEENTLVKNDEKKSIVENLLNGGLIAAQDKHNSSSIVLDKLLAGMPWHIQLAGSNKMTDNEIVCLSTIRQNSAHHCIIVVAATELINDCGWPSWLLRKPRYVALHSRVRLSQEDLCYKKCNATENQEVKQLELEYERKECAEIYNEMEIKHCKEHICQSLPLSVSSSVSRATSNEILPSSKHENHESNERQHHREHNFKKALSSLAVPMAMEMCSSTEVNKHSVKEILQENEEFENIINLTKVIVNDVMFVEYLQYLILHIREKANDLIPHIVITKMDCVGGVGCVYARQAITKVLDRCISSNHIYFVANNTLTNTVLPFDNWNNTNVDACTRHECLRLHQQLSLELMWRMRVDAYNKTNNISSENTRNGKYNVFRIDEKHE